MQIAEEVRNQKKEEAQLLAEALLDAEVKLGELFQQLPKAQGFASDKGGVNHSVHCCTKCEDNDTKTKKEIIQDLGFEETQAKRFETLAKNKDLVGQVKQEARENDDIPTRTQVLSLAKARKQMQEQKEEEYKEFCANSEKGKKLFNQLVDSLGFIKRLKSEDIELSMILLDLISKSFNNMFRGNKKVKKICKGYFRGIEVTYNKNDNTYHPHIHCIIVVDKGYFSWRNEYYIKTEEWASIWQYYLKVDYTPIVDVRKVKSKNYNNNGVIEISKYSGVAEISKYTVKSKDIIITRNNGDVNEELTDNNIYILHFVLKGKRLVTFGGIMKELHKKLNLEDMNSDNVDLIRTDVEDDNNILNYIILKYKWSVGISNYKLVFN